MSKKMRLLGGSLGVSIFLGLSSTFTPVLAANNEYLEDTVIASEIIEGTSDELSPEELEMYEELLFTNKHQKGDVIVLGELEGEMFCVEVTEVTEGDGIQPLATGTIPVGETATIAEEYTFYRTTLFGGEDELFKVRAECTWISGSKIKEFSCTCTPLSSKVTCSWNNSYKKYSEVLCTLGLDFSYKSKSGVVFFSANLDVARTSATVDSSKTHIL